MLKKCEECNDFMLHHMCMTEYIHKQQLEEKPDKHKVYLCSNCVGSYFINPTASTTNENNAKQQDGNKDRNIKHKLSSKKPATNKKHKTKTTSSTTGNRRSARITMPPKYYGKNGIPKPTIATEDTKDNFHATLPDMDNIDILIESNELQRMMQYYGFALSPPETNKQHIKDIFKKQISLKEYDSTNHLKLWESMKETIAAKNYSVDLIQKLALVLGFLKMLLVKQNIN